MDKIQRWANVIGVISAVIALASLAVTVRNIRSDAMKARINEWQEVAVFSIITDAGLDGVSFGDIQSQYKTKAGDLPDELPRTEIQTQALKRVLLSLLAKRAIAVRSDGRYGVALESTPLQVYRMMERAPELEKLGDEIFQIVSKHPGRYTADELEILLKGRFKFSSEEFTHLLSNMQAQDAITIDSSNGKISGLSGSNR